MKLFGASQIVLLVLCHRLSPFLLVRAWSSLESCLRFVSVIRKAWLGLAWLGWAGLGLAWLAWLAWLGSLGLAWLGLAGLCLAVLGCAWLGLAGLGLAWLGWLGLLGWAWLARKNIEKPMVVVRVPEKKLSKIIVVRVLAAKKHYKTMQRNCFVIKKLHVDYAS